MIDLCCRQEGYYVEAFDCAVRTGSSKMYALLKSMDEKKSRLKVLTFIFMCTKRLFC